MDKSCIIIILLLVIIYGLFNQKNNKEKFVENNKQFEYPWYEGEEKTNFVKDVNTSPIHLLVKANSGENTISISSINGFRIGDRIQIESSNGNKENNLVAGIGNNILELNSKLINNHLPNANVYNLTNPDIKNKTLNNNQTTKFYATLDSNDKLKYNNPGDPWGSSNYVNTIGGYQYTYDQAKQACQKEGARLCSISEIINKDICSAGWTSNKIRGYPMANGGSPGCGGKEPGWRTWSTNLNNKGSAHCCKTNTNI